jgi:hypothetical protein
LGILRYAKGPYQPSSQPPTYDYGIPQGVVLNPLDARCNEIRDDAICVSQLKNALDIDKGVLRLKPDIKIFLPFRFHLYTPEDLFAPHTYNRHLGKSRRVRRPQVSPVRLQLPPTATTCSV